MNKKKGTTLLPQSQDVVSSRNFNFGTYRQMKSGTVSLTFDLSRAPIPENIFSASYSFFSPGKNHETFINFIQINSLTMKPKHCIQIRMDDIALVNFWRNSKDFFKRIEDWYNQIYQEKPESIEKLELIPESINSIQVSANLIFSAHQDSSAIMAFYYFDPRAAREFALGGTADPKLIATPIIEVKTNTYVIYDLLSQINKYVDKLMINLPNLAKPNDQI